MTNDLTFNSIVFKKAWDNQTESLRRSTARGINAPDELQIRSQSYVDSTTKIAGTRYNGTVTRVVIDALTGLPYRTQFYFVLAVPGNAVAGDITAITATFKAAVADTDLIAAVLNGER